VGVVETGLGAAFGINIESTDDEIIHAAEQFRRAVRRINGKVLSQ
jgi:hypothetical protein